MPVALLPREGAILSDLSRSFLIEVSLFRTAIYCCFTIIPYFFVVSDRGFVGSEKRPSPALAASSKGA